MNAKPKILIVDDDEDILDLLKYNLVKEGYTVRTLSSSVDAVPVAMRFLPDLVVLDVMMPFLNGIDLCRQLRHVQAFRDVFIFFLAAKSDEYFKHAVYNVGGDEFVEKIVGLKPLLSKISAVLKKDYVIRKRLMKLKIGSLELYRGVETVYKNGAKMQMNKQEFEILFFLAQNPGKKIALIELIESLWGSKTFMDESSVKRCLGNLQAKLGKNILKESRMDCYQFNGAR